MADLNKIVQRYEAKSDTSGLDSMAASADEAAASTGKLSTAAEKLSTETTKADKSVLGVATQLDRVSRAADPAQKALAAVERQQRLIDAATKQGQPIREEWSRALSILQARHRDLTKATGEHTAAIGLNRIQSMELIHIGRSLADTWVTQGVSLRSLAMEGGRLGQVFSEGNGGFGGTLKAMAGTVGRLATGWIGLGVGIAGGMALAGAAVVRFQSQQDELALSLNGVGRASGVSLGGLTAIANSAGARNPALGQGGATNLAAELSSTGKISSSLMPGIMDLATPFAHGTGQSISAAGSELAKAFADPVKGAEMLNEKLGFLDATTKHTIESFERQGNLLAAQQTLLTKAADAAQNLGDRTWRIAGAWDRISGTIGSAFTRVGSTIEGAVNGASPEDRVRGLVANRTDPRSVNRTIFQRPATSDEITENILQLRRGAIDPARNNDAKAAADKLTNDLSIQVLGVIKSASPETTRAGELNDTLKLLNDALRNPDIVSKTPGGALAIGDAAQRTQNMLTYSDPAARARQEGLLSAQAIQAQTGAERTLIEARKAEIEAMAAGSSAALQAAKSLTIWNDAIAQSNKQADDALREANQRAGLLGLSPLQRSLRESDFRYDEMRRNAVTGIPADAAISFAPRESSDLKGNNPGNIQNSAIAARFGGGGDGRFAQFPTVAAGYQAANANLDAYSRQGLTTPRQIIMRWAPPSENDTSGYIASISRMAGVDPDSPLSPSKRADFLRAMTQIEKGKSPYSSGQISGFIGGGLSPAGIGSDVVAAARLAPGNINVGGAIPSRSSLGLGIAQQSDRNTILESMTTEKIGQSSDELKRNQDLLDVRTKSIGMTTDAMQKAIHVQEDWNELQLTAADRAILGTDRINKLGVSINSLADKQVAYEKQQAQNQMLMNASNSFQQMGNSFVSSAGNDLGSLFNANPRDLASQLSVGDQAKFYSGQMSGSQVKSQVFKNQIGDLIRSMLFQQGIGMVQKGLFGSGQYGQPGSTPGLLGGIFNGLLGGLTGGGGGGGAAGGGLFSGIAHLFGFADGGVMTSAGAMPLRRYAGGGVANSPQMAMYGEGSKPEAYVPLPDGRRIPVAMQGGGGSGVNFRGGDLHVHGSIDSASLPQVQAMIERGNKQTMFALQRNFGAMSAKWSQRVGA